MTGWEGRNKYRIRNTLGQDVYFAVEGKLLCIHSAHISFEINPEPLDLTPGMVIVKLCEV